MQRLACSPARPRPPFTATVVSIGEAIAGRRVLGGPLEIAVPDSKLHVAVFSSAFLFRFLTQNGVENSNTRCWTCGGYNDLIYYSGEQEYVSTPSLFPTFAVARPQRCWEGGGAQEHSGICHQCLPCPHADHHTACAVDATADVSKLPQCSGWPFPRATA